MSVLLEGTEHLEQELTPERIAAPATGSILLHLGLAAGIVLYGILGGFFHHNFWGSPGTGGAIQVNLVSSSIPLPSNQPVNQNVLSTETPSQAPAPPTPKAKQAEDDTAIPISGKQKKQEKETAHKTPPQKQEPVPTNRANYGEQAGSSIPRAAQPSLSNGPTSVTNGDFGSRFGWYVDGISRKMSSNWYKALVDQNTPRGARSYIDFTIARDGSVSNVRLDRSSGSPTLDSSCMRAAQRVDTFGALPAGYNQSTLLVSYYCEY
ncbi:MAG TPA: energy transducer TonB [Terracidiphilus sp.]|jgi:protein TonB|nr:energy transducer TonB [Terracidiphilus sp.]